MAIVLKVKDIEQSNTLIDAVQLEAIAAGAPQVVLEILQDFEGSFNVELSAILSSSGQASAPAWLDFFHRVKGSGGTLGLSSLQAASFSLELAAKEGVLPSEEVQEGYRSLLEASCEEARKFLSATGGGSF